MILNCRWSLNAGGRISRLHCIYVSAFLFPNIPLTLHTRWCIKCRSRALDYILIWLCFKNSYKTLHFTHDPDYDPASQKHCRLCVCTKHGNRNVGDAHQRREGESTLSVTFTYWRYDSNVLDSIKCV